MVKVAVLVEFNEHTNSRSSELLFFKVVYYSHEYTNNPTLNVLWLHNHFNIFEYTGGIRYIPFFDECVCSAFIGLEYISVHDRTTTN